MLAWGRVAAGLSRGMFWTGESLGPREGGVQGVIQAGLSPVAGALLILRWLLVPNVIHQLLNPERALVHLSVHHQGCS